MPNKYHNINIFDRYSFNDQGFYACLFQYEMVHGQTILAPTAQAETTPKQQGAKID